MLRTRLLSLGVAAALGLVTGCASHHSWFGRSECNGCNGCGPTFETESSIITQGPVLEDRGPFTVSPGCSGPGCNALAPQPMVPQLAPAPRLQAQPQAAPSSRLLDTP